NAAPANEPTFLAAHDTNGDGTTDFVSAFYSTGGITGIVAEFSPISGLAVGQYAANVGNFADLSGVWDNGGHLVTVVQTGQKLLITDQNGVTQGCLLSGSNVLLFNGSTNVKVAVVDH